MSLLSRIFGAKLLVPEKASGAQASTPEFDRLLAFGGALMRLLKEDRYIGSAAIPGGLFSLYRLTAARYDASPG